MQPNKKQHCVPLKNDAMKKTLMTLVKMFNYQLYQQKLKKINMGPVCMLFVIIK